MLLCAIAESIAFSWFSVLSLNCVSISLLWSVPAVPNQNKKHACVSVCDTCDIIAIAEKHKIPIISDEIYGISFEVIAQVKWFLAESLFIR